MRPRISSRLRAVLLTMATVLCCASTEVVAQSAWVSHGDAFFIDAKGGKHRLTKGGTVSEAVLSPDGRRVAYLKTVPGPKISGPLSALDGDFDPQEIWLVRTDGTGRRKLSASLPTPEVGVSKRAGLANLEFSGDGKFLYFSNLCAVVSGCLHQVDIAQATTKLFSGANKSKIVKSGRFLGYVLVVQHRYYRCGGSFEELVLLSPTGEEVMDLGPDEPELWEAFDKANRDPNAEEKLPSLARPTNPNVGLPDGDDEGC